MWPTSRSPAMLLVALALSFLVAPLLAEAQPQGTIPRIGYLTDSAAPQEVEAFRNCSGGRALR
jgi:hypothetical protein